MSSLDYIRPDYRGQVLYTGDKAYLFGKPPKRTGRPLVVGQYTPGGWKKAERLDHPCPRSIDHVRWLVSVWSNRDDVVIDPFAGSGTTGLACLYTRRRFVGIEIVPKYFDGMVHRLEAAWTGGPLMELLETQSRGVRHA